MTQLYLDEKVFDELDAIVQESKSIIKEQRGIVVRLTTDLSATIELTRREANNLEERMQRLQKLEGQMIKQHSATTLATRMGPITS